MERKKKILILEDESVLGELLLEKLTAEGYLTKWEVDGEAGLRTMRETMPDLVLLDIIMPKKDGYEVLEEMQKDSILKNIPVIVISNSGQPVEIKRILELGAKEYIVKAQFSPAEVLDKVRTYLDTAELSKEAKEGKEESPQASILIVEDDPFLSSIIATYLEQEGYKVSVSTDGERSLALLEKEIPDLILLDIVMPGVSGFDVLKALKADERYKNISVIMFSNLGQEHEVEESKTLGADYFLIKANFTPQEVLLKIKELLKKKGRI
jgi:DNA-binding response OmpR family regulator